MPLTPEKMNERGLLHRTFEVRGADPETRTVELAFSSEAEVERWFGVEILDHDPGAIRLGRLQGGAPLLVNHDWDDQVGVIESVSIGTDRKGRAVVRFGRSVRASEIFQDVVDGIRRLVSVGYMVHGTQLAEKRDGTDVYRVTDWEPFEISIVSVPADTTVGVGRGAEKAQVAEGTPAPEANPEARESAAPDIPPEEPKMADPNNPAPADTTPAASGGDNRNHARAIAEMGRQYGQTDLAARAIAEGKTVEAFQRDLLDAFNARAAQPLGEQMRHAETGLNDREQRQFSFVKLIRAAIDPSDRAAAREAAFELEACAAAAEKAGKQTRGMVIPVEVLTRNVMASGTSGTPAGNTGGNTIAENLMAGSFIEMLRNRAVLMRLATTMGGLVGNVDIPRQTAGATAAWIGEDGDSTVRTQTIDQISLNPRTLAAHTEITRRLLMQSSIDVEAMVRRDLAAAVALEIDRAGFYGTAASNQPRGIVSNAGINAVDFGGTGGADAGGPGNSLPTFAEIVRMETEIASDNADVSSMAYVMNAAMRGHLKTTPRFGSGTESTIWEPGNTVNGYRTEVTNQILAGDVIFGNFSDLLVGMWGGIEINVDPYTHSTKGRIRIVTFQDVDFAVRRVESFCLGRDSG
jgi:HK97 family phage major capsid protein/HK97 family phage prohead protease